MTLQNRACQVVKSAYGASGHAEAKDQLQKEFPHVDWDEIVSAYLDASHLHDAAFIFGEQIWSGALTEQRALEEMKAAHPGFSDSAYREFLSSGLDSSSR